MFDTLMESRRRRERRMAGTIASVAVHAAIIGLAAFATMRTVTPVRASPPPERPIWVETPARPGGPSTAARPSDAATSSSPATPDVPTVPIRFDFDPRLPAVGLPIDMSAVVGRIEGSPGDIGTSSGSGPLAPEGIFTTSSVERIAALRAGSPTPRYPESLRAAGIEGRVHLRLVVDTLGRVESGSPAVLDSTDPRFTAAVQSVLPRLRFTPAMAGGRRVRMYVEMPFVFEIERR